MRYLREIEPMVSRFTDGPPLVCHRYICMAVAILGMAMPFRMSQAAANSPRPFICMYGHSDNAGVTDAFRKLVPRINVIEGTSRNAAFIRELRQQRCIYAAHVNSPPGASLDELVKRWKAPFEDNLGGQLPGGYDAIAIDELRADADGSPQSAIVCEALKTVRNAYPKKQIYAAATWQLGRNSRKHTEQLRAVNQYVDILMLEVYLRESRPAYGYIANWAAQIQAISPDLLSKTVYGLGIAQRGYLFDDTTTLSFLAHLDHQFHVIRKDRRSRHMPGVMFWAYYRSQTEILPEYLARLSQHYFHKGRMSRYGDGKAKQLVDNPQLENASGWELISGGGRVELFEYKSVPSIEPDHDSNGWAQHGARGLSMTRGERPSRARTVLSGLDPRRVHVASAWVHSTSARNGAGIRLLGRDDRVLGEQSTRRAGTGSQWDKWTRLLVTFVPDGPSVKLELNDTAARRGSTLYWDFVEAESAWPIDNR